MRAGAARTGDEEGISYVDACAIALDVARDALLDGAAWITTDVGDQFDLTPESERRRRERAIIASDKARGR